MQNPRNLSGRGGELNVFFWAQEQGSGLARTVAWENSKREESYTCKP